MLLSLHNVGGVAFMTPTMQAQLTWRKPHHTLHGRHACRPSDVLWLTIEQATRVAQNFVRADMTVAMFGHETINHLIDLTQLLLVGRAC